MIDVNITDAVFAAAERHPEAAAIIDGDNVISFKSLCSGICLATRRFLQAAWEAGDVIGISIAASRPLHLVAALALARSGITQVALPRSDPAALLRSRTKALGVSGLISDTPPDAVFDIDTMSPDAGWLGSGVVRADDLRRPGGDRAWIISETSGTTAQPKVAAISHAAGWARDRQDASVLGQVPGERYLNLTGLRFLTGMERAIRCLGNGGTVVFAPLGLSYTQLFAWIDAHDIAYLSGVPLHFHQMLAEARGYGPRLPSLRVLRCSSAALPSSTLNEVRRRLSSNLHVSYGATEAGPMAAATPAILAEHPDSVGQPLPGIDFEIVDDRDEPVPPGSVGRVRVRGPGVLSAYLRAGTEDEARVFHRGWFYPGDLATRNEEGLVFLKGRGDEAMNFDGIMVWPGEIEDVLRQHPEVLDVAAFPMPSPEHQDVPAVAIVASRPLTIEQLSGFCADRLGLRAPRFFLQLREIPKNPMGKVVRRRLSELALAALRDAKDRRRE